MDKITENIQKVLSLSNDLEIVVGLGKAETNKNKIIVSLEPGWIVEEESWVGEAGYGDTFDDAFIDYMNKTSGKYFQVEAELKEPYEVKLPW